MIIGPPGAGKTTALLNSGLRFPLAAEMGQAPVAGVGGTRNCDWWFTDEAVLIDTAGRYTTQDSDAAVDSAGWEALPRPAQAHPRAPAAERRDRRHRLSDIAQPRRAAERLAHAPRDPPPRARSSHDQLGVRAAGLRAVHQGRPDRRLHRVLRRPRPREARPGLGHDLPADQAATPATAGTVRRRVRSCWSSG